MVRKPTAKEMPEFKRNGDVLEVDRSALWAKNVSMLQMVAVDVFKAYWNEDSGLSKKELVTELNYLTTNIRGYLGMDEYAVADNEMWIKVSNENMAKIMEALHNVEEITTGEAVPEVPDGELG